MADDKEFTTPVVIERTEPEKSETPPLQDSPDKVDSKVIDERVANRQSIYDKFNKDHRPAREEQVIEDDGKGDDKPEPKGEVKPELNQDPEKVKVKIYGQDRLVDKKEVDAAGGVKEYQKKVAAAEKAQIERDKQFIEQERLKLAQEQRELERLKRELPQKGAPGKESNLPSDDAAKRDDIKSALKQAGESLLDGEVADFSEKLAQYLADNPNLGRRGEVVDIDRIVQEVEQRTIRNMTEKQYKAQLEDAVEAFNVEYPDLSADPELFSKVDRRTIILQEEHPDKPPLEIVRMAAEEVRKVYAPRNPAQAPRTATRSDKLAEKRVMSKMSGGSDRATPPPAPKQPTRSDYVMQLKKQRGQM